MKRIAIIGDSNSTSYLEDETNLTPLNYLYSFHLAKKKFDVIPMAFVSNDTQKIIDRSQFFIKNAQVEYMILQIGWIDSSPKLYPKWLEFIIKLRIKGIKKILQKIVSNYNEYYKKKYVPNISIDNFENNLKKIIKIVRDHNKNCRILFLTIPYSEDLVINYQREKYNKIITKIAIEEKCKIVKTYELTKKEGMLNKTGHFSEKAHQQIAEMIEKYIA